MQLSQFLANPAALQRHFLKDIHEVGEFSGATIYVTGS
jgi:hypothetical protein